MNVDQMKDHAVKLLHTSADGDVEAVRALINDDFVYQLMQKGQFRSGNSDIPSTQLNKEDFLTKGVPVSRQITRDGIHFTIELILVDGPWVATFGFSNATSLKGKPYNNNYCWRMLFSGNGVSEFREYCDTHHAHDVLFEK